MTTEIPVLGKLRQEDDGWGQPALHRDADQIEKTQILFRSVTSGDPKSSSLWLIASHFLMPPLTSPLNTFHQLKLCQLLSQGSHRGREKAWYSVKGPSSRLTGMGGAAHSSSWECFTRSRWSLTIGSGTLGWALKLLSLATPLPVHCVLSVCRRHMATSLTIPLPRFSLYRHLPSLTVSHQDTKLVWCIRLCPRLHVLRTPTREETLHWL